MSIETKKLKLEIKKIILDNLKEIIKDNEDINELFLINKIKTILNKKCLCMGEIYKTRKRTHLSIDIKLINYYNDVETILQYNLLI